MWKKIKLKDICEIFNGGTPSSKEKTFWGEGIQWLTPKDMGKMKTRSIFSTERQITKSGLANSSAKLIPENSVILSCRAPIGHVAINQVPMSFNQGCKGLVPKDELLTEFLYYFLISSKKLLNKLGSGTTFKEISGRTLSNVEMLLPPLAEQREIVNKLDSIFCEIDKATQLVDQKLLNNKSIIFSSLGQIFDNEKEKWETNTLNNLCLLERGSSPRPIKRYIRDEGVNWIKIGDTSLDGKYIKSTKQKISKEGSEKSRYVHAGDLVLTNSMSYGRPYIMATDGCIHDGWFVLRLNKDVDTEFFFYLLSSPLVQNQFHRLAAGAVVKNISSDLVKRTLIPLPSKSRQLEIRDKFIKMETYIEDHLNLLKSEKEALISLKSATLSTELRSKKGL